MNIIQELKKLKSIQIKKLTLNKLNRQIISINDENADLQNKLDSLKSFNNVDMQMLQSNLLQKADNVIEVAEVAVPTTKIKPTLEPSTPFKWEIGY